METIKFKGEECHTMGVFPKVGDKARYFLLTTSGLNDVELCDYKGRCVVLNIFPSLDTDVCAMSVRRFNEMASLLDDVVVLCVSMDLPFAAKRFRSPLFGRKYGVELIDGPLAGLLARGVVVIGENNRVIYSQLVDEITNEPDYEECYEALRLYQSVIE